METLLVEGRLKKRQAANHRPEDHFTASLKWIVLARLRKSNAFGRQTNLSAH
jgi:hypothetical protein